MQMQDFIFKYRIKKLALRLQYIRHRVLGCRHKCYIEMNMAFTFSLLLLRLLLVNGSK